MILIFAALWAVSCAAQGTFENDVRTPESEIKLPPTRTNTTVASPTPTKIDPTGTVKPTPTPNPVITTENFQICSPLGRETVQSIFEIVSDPYRPPSAGSLEARHHGVDFSHYSRDGFATIEGETVHVVLEGRVASVIRDRLPYGNMMIIETAFSGFPSPILDQLPAEATQSIYILYAHMKEAPAFEIGENLTCGQEIGVVGKTGYNIVNPHLHLETRIGEPGAVFESMAFYTTTASSIEMENYKLWRTSGEFTHMDPMRLFELYLGWTAD